LIIVAADVPDKNVRGLLALLQKVAETTPRRLSIDWYGGPIGFEASPYPNLEIVSHGMVDNNIVRQSVARSLCFVAYPSRTIFDLAILEAMSASTPVLCPRLQGFVEALGSDYPLYFNDADELSACLNALNDPAYRHVLGQQLHQRAMDNFTMEHMLRAYTTVLEDSVRATT